MLSDPSVYIIAISRGFVGLDRARVRRMSVSMAF